MAGTDRYRVNLGTAERQVLSSLPLQLAELLGTGDPSLVRLFPPAYVGEDSLQEEYEELMGTQLEKHHRSCLESLAESATAAELTKDQLEKWLAAINDIRLVLGTRLNVSEEIEEVSDTN
ncbi:MAG: DUF2017 domain-containing protein [Actinobacteria bacterium]|nr:DUF2017 domain-containing protein [Actinomycetota bacterium]